MAKKYLSLDDWDNVFSVPSATTSGWIINAFDGNDNIRGGQYADYLYGGCGADIISGGQGNDVIDGDGVAIQSQVEALEGVWIKPPSPLKMGVGGNDTINGGTGDDLIIGGVGNDVLIGDSGKDTIFGGLGDDIIDGDNVTTTTATVGVYYNDTLYGEDGNDTITGGIGNDKLYGGNGDDILPGNADSDYIDGGTGNDILRGGGGTDTLVGGDGYDVFQFNSMGTINADSIQGGFIVGEDIIQLLSSAFPNLKVDTVNNVNDDFANYFNITGDGIPEGGDDYITYNTNTGVLSYDVDGSGTAPKVTIALLGVGLDLTADSFAVRSNFLVSGVTDIF